MEILGSAYEQFLGKVIRIDKAHRAKIEEKPEVRKAGGVYYTPQYIVDYIVQKTVGPLLDEKTPKQIETQITQLARELSKDYYKDQPYVVRIHQRCLSPSLLTLAAHAHARGGCPRFILFF